ncbi:MAG: pilin [Minisyncoccia bacterium]
MKKYLLSILASLLISLSVGVVALHAQTYVPLAPLPGTLVAGANTTNLSTYLSGAIKLLIAIGASLSILMAIIGGLQYVAAGISPDAKSTAKTRITNAFIGLALILTSYLILSSINPKLVAFDLSLKKVSPSKPTPTESAPSEDGTQSHDDDPAVLDN